MILLQTLYALILEERLSTPLSEAAQLRRAQVLGAVRTHRSL